MEYKEAICKRVYRFNGENKCILRSDNQEYKDLILENGDMDKLLVFGEIIAIWKKPVIKNFEERV